MTSDCQEILFGGGGDTVTEVSKGRSCSHVNSVQMAHARSAKGDQSYLMLLKSIVRSITHLTIRERRQTSFGQEREGLGFCNPPQPSSYLASSSLVFHASNISHLTSHCTPRHNARQTPCCLPDTARTSSPSAQCSATKAASTAALHAKDAAPSHRTSSHTTSTTLSRPASLPRPSGRLPRT